MVHDQEKNLSDSPLPSASPLAQQANAANPGTSPTATATAVEPADAVLSHEQHLLRFVRDLQAHCPICDYNLHRMTSPDCPECGHTLKLDVRSAEPYLRWWILLVVGLAMPAGPGIIGGIFFVAEWVRWGWPFSGMFTGPWDVYDVWGLFIFVYLAIAPPATVAAIVLRRKFCLLPVVVQRVVGPLPMLANLTILGFALWDVIYW